MNKLLEKIKNFFSAKSEKKEEPKPQQEEPKAQEKPKEQKQIVKKIRGRNQKTSQGENGDSKFTQRIRQGKTAGFG